MNRCLLTYEEIPSGNYHAQALKRISPKLTDIVNLSFDAASLRHEAAARAGKMSIQGIQPKLSAVLNVKDSAFEIVDHGGRYILKPQSDTYPNLPENEDLTMHLAKMVEIEVPIHGLLRAKDDSLVYFIKRFDRIGHKDRVPTEDFAQLMGLTRETKYRSSMENVASIIGQYCTFPVIEKRELLKRTFFNYLIGNEDMHLKNFTLISTDNVVKLAPAYDFLNSSLVLREPEEIALPVRGKKRGLTRKILIDYFGQERLGFTDKVIEGLLEDFRQVVPSWKIRIQKSFLSEEFKTRYESLLEERISILL